MSAGWTEAIRLAVNATHGSGSAGDGKRTGIKAVRHHLNGRRRAQRSVVIVFGFLNADRLSGGVGAAHVESGNSRFRLLSFGKKDESVALMKRGKKELPASNTI